MGRGFASFDTDTDGGLPEARKFVRTLQVRHATPVGSPDEVAFGNSPEEIAFNEGSRDVADLEQAGKGMARNDDGRQRLALVPKAPSAQP